MISKINSIDWSFQVPSQSSAHAPIVHLAAEKAVQKDNGRSSATRFAIRGFMEIIGECDAIWQGGGRESAERKKTWPR